MNWTEELDLSRRPLRGRVLLFVLAGIVLLIGLGNPPVSRTQEARVLETARQMLPVPLERRLIPELNGDVRLQKPPLPYWYTAIGLQVFGENEFAGRLPTALLAWLTLLVTYLAVSQLYDVRTGFLAAAMLMGGYLFARHSRLAETDVPATLFTTLAVLAAIRAVKDRNSTADLHLFALAVGLVIVTKGGPAIFSVLFFVALAIVERRWDLPVRLFKTGAIFTLTAVAIPWFAYVAYQHGGETFLHELRNTAEGGDHSGSSLEYIAVLAWGAAPWSVALPFAILAAVKGWKPDFRCRVNLLWIAAIALPLILNGNKQKHYLLPLLPALMGMIAWWIVEIWKQVRLSSVVAGTMAVVVPQVVTFVAPGLTPSPVREVAERIGRGYRTADLRFYGDNFSPVLSFNMRKRIPIADDPANLPENATLLVIGKQDRPAVEPPLPFALIEQFDVDEHTYAFYRKR